MGFWGIEVKPGKPHPYHSDNVQGRLYITQATLGLGSKTERTILQCSVGHKSPIFLCSLLPDRIESCSLNLEFKDELVAFSVIGPRSIHLSGYFVSDEGDHLRDEYESDSGEDISETESEESSEYDYGDGYYDEDFIDDDDLETYQSSPVRSSAVVIEEMLDDDNPANGNGPSKRLEKKNHLSDDDDQHNYEQQIVVKKSSSVSVFESEDEDGFPISASKKVKVMVQEPQLEQDGQEGKRTTKENKKKKARDGSDDVTDKKRKVKSTDQDGQPEREKKKKKQKQKEMDKSIDFDVTDGDDKTNDISKDDIVLEEVNRQDSSDGNEHDQRDLDIDADSVPGENSADKKKKKKKKRKKKNKDQYASVEKNKDQTVSAVGDEVKSSLEFEEKQSTAKPLQVRTYPNGLVIEELAIGKPDGKRAYPGSQVSVHYIGKLKKNGKIFDSNVGRAPFKFRLAVGQVIKGWDVGINGMRIGDKRRLTIPPSMGYGDKGVGGKIPPNAWLVFDVELVNVR